MLEVKSQGETVAYINRQSPLADGHIRETPWLLLYVRGRIERFATRAEARAEARKSWPAVTFGEAATRLTKPQRAALEHLATGESLRGFVHASTYWALVRMKLIEDLDTITETGRKALRG